MTNTNAILGLGIMLVCSACSSPRTDPETLGQTTVVSTPLSIRRTDGVTLNGLRGSHMTMSELSLCQVLELYRGGAGLYSVGAITSYMEERPGKAPHPSTYVELFLEEAWTANAPASPVVRVRGGVYPNGVYGGFPISLQSGESVGLILKEPTATNLGFYSLSPHGVFRDVDGRGYMTNGVLFARTAKSASEIGALVSSATSRGPARCHEADVVADIANDPPVRLPGRGEAEYLGEHEGTIVNAPGAVEVLEPEPSPVSPTEPQR